MEQVQVGTYGVTIRANAAYNMASYTDLKFRFYKPEGTTFTVAAVLGTATTTTDDGAVLAANKWAYYVTQSGDLDVAGTWGLKLEFTDSVATLFLPSKIKSFRVNT